MANSGKLDYFSIYKKWLFTAHIEDSPNARTQFLKESALTKSESDEAIQAIIKGFDNPESSEPMKFDQDKLKWSLLPMEVIREAVKRFTLGAKKYSPGNWQRVNPEQYYDALMRHLDAWRSGEDYDEDAVLNGETLTHLSAVLWNAIVLVWFDLQKKLKLKKEAQKAIKEIRNETN